jgi:hypothetical protein
VVFSVTALPAKDGWCVKHFVAGLEGFYADTNGFNHTGNIVANDCWWSNTCPRTIGADFVIHRIDRSGMNPH